MAEDKIDVKERYAKILYQAKDFQNAIKEASEFLKTDPNNVVMNRLMGYSNLELNNDAEALKYLNKVFEVAKPGKILPQDYEFIDTPEDIRDKYQYFTEADMNKLTAAGYRENFTSLEEGVKDYVTNFLQKRSYY